MRKYQLNRAGYFLFLNLAIISAVLIGLKIFSIIDQNIFLSKNTLSVILIASITATIVFKSNLDDLRNRNGQFIDSIFQASPYFFLSILIILAVNQFLKIDFITQRNIILTALGVAFGFLAFYKNRDKIEKDLEDEKQKEEDEEKRRYDNFPYKFPTLSRVWGLNGIVRWMYKEGWFYSVGLILIVALGFVLRIWKFNNLGLAFDEVFQVFSANSLNDGFLPSMGNGLYLRGILISYLGFFISNIGFDSLVAVRIPVVLAGILIIPLVYVISKKIGITKKYSLLVATLVCLELMLIQFSRISRFYLISTLAILFFLLLFLSLKKPKILPLIILTIFSFLSEISITIFLVASLFTTYFIVNIKNLKEDKKYLFSILIIILSLLIFFFFYMLIYQSTFLDRILTLNLEANYLHKYVYWLFSVYPHYVLLAFVGLITTLKRGNNKKFIPIFFFIFLMILLAINLLDYNYTIRSFIVLIPVMFLASIKGLSSISRIVPKILTITFAALMIFSLIYDLKDLPINYGDKYNMEKIMYEKLPIVLDWENPSIYIRDHYEEGDILVSHAVNPYFLYYYIDKKPDLSVRHIGTSRYVNGTYYDQFSEIRVIDNSDDLDSFIKESLDNGKRVWVLSSGVNWGVDNPFYEKYFGKPIILEAPTQITDYLRIQQDNLEYIGKDNMTRIYLFKGK